MTWTKMINSVNTTSSLNGKKWVVFGDSTSNYNQKPYWKWIQEQTGVVPVNKAYPGYRMSRQGSLTNILLDKILSDYDLPVDADYITLMAGYNDRGGSGFTEGTLLNVNGTVNTDEYTLYGAFNSAINRMINRCPNARISLFTIMPNGDYASKNSATNISTVKVIKEVSAFYSIPCLDMYNESGLPSHVNLINTNYYQNDRLHPNDAGHEIMARKIRPFLERI